MFYVWLESLSHVPSYSILFKDLHVYSVFISDLGPGADIPRDAVWEPGPWHQLTVEEGQYYVLYLPGQDQYWHAPGGSVRWNAAQCCEKWAEWRVKESESQKVWEWLTGRWRVWSRQPLLKWNPRARRILWRSTQTGPTIIWRKQRWQHTGLTNWNEWWLFSG